MKKILGIVVEFNPLHNGHLYFINEAQKQINPDITIAIMSSSFAMRGDVMVIDKFTRTQLMLDYGIDLILELPFLSAVQSSDYFCYNAIKILDCFKITHLAFGAEMPSMDKLQQLLKLTNSETFNNLLKTSLNKGHSYPASALGALKQLTTDSELITNFTLPNNTLALGYLKALQNINPQVTIVPILRHKAQFYEESPTDNFITSANAIRKMLINNEDISNYVPSKVNNTPFIDQLVAEENLLLLLRHTFNLVSLQEISTFFGVNEGIENRIASFLDVAEDYQELVSLIETKRYPRNRIKRILLHIILQTPKRLENKYHYYLRILGFNNNGEKYLSTLPTNTKEKLISNLKNIHNNDIITLELKASKLYSLITNHKEFYKNEFTGPIKNINKGDLK